MTSINELPQELLECILKFVNLYNRHAPQLTTKKLNYTWVDLRQRRKLYACRGRTTLTVPTSAYVLWLRTLNINLCLCGHSKIRLYPYGPLCCSVCPIMYMEYAKRK